MAKETKELQKKPIQLISEEKIEKQRKKIVYLFISYFNWVIIGLALFILILGYFLLVQPKYQYITEEIIAVTKWKEEEFTQRQRYLDRLIKLDNAYSSIDKDNIEKIEILLPKFSGAEEILSQLEFIVLRNGLFLTSINVSEAKVDPSKRISKSNQKDSPEQTGSKIGEIKIDMGVAGADYTSFKKLLKTIENNLRIYDILETGFSGSGTNLQFLMSTYYLK